MAACESIRHCSPPNSPEQAPVPANGPANYRPAAMTAYVAKSWLARARFASMCMQLLF
ncbi:hypothetical protein IQ07DRAFT_591347 [Pyrenochaeta sp. DS3sAY3a]|nr:hypothetical protein IQ07DRAFT_591347 [Pyrenochaeta sp. DS3sAY3a]